MAEFIPFNETVEVNGETVLTIVNAFPDFMQEKAIEILKNNNIVNPQIGEWYSQKSWLNTFKEISDNFGPNTLFKIGKAIPENAQFPPGIDSIEKALGLIDVAYQMNHRNGEIGYYKLLSFDAIKKEARMECKTPYPCDFDKGIITAMARKFESIITVTLDINKKNKKQGSDSSWYKIKY